MIEEFGAVLSSEDRIVKKERVEKADVSTVFLGIDHRFIGIGPPMLFETMIFYDDDSIPEYQTRCCTYEEALVMHEKALSHLKNSAQ